MQCPGSGPAWPALPQSISTGIKALVFLRGTRGTLVTIREIAEATGVPKPYLGKILHYLRRAGFVEARRGHGGGVALARDASEISVFDVILALEGESWRGGCLLYPDKPEEQVECSVRGIWGDLRSVIEERLRAVTLDGLPDAPSSPETT